MTSTGGTGRPTADEVREQAPDAPASGETGSSVNGSGSPDPAVQPRRSATSGEPAAGPRGAAAARSATAGRRKTRPSSADEVSAAPTPPAPPSSAAPNEAPSVPPVTPPAVVQAAEAANSYGRQPAPKPPGPARGPRPAPVPPPSAQASGYATQAAPMAPPAGQPLLDDTQVSLDARPVGEARPVAPERPATSQRTQSSRRPPRVRKARLRLVRVDPWSVMKTSFLLSVAIGIALFVAVAVLWSVLDAAGVFTSITEIITDFTASSTSEGIDVDQYVELSRVLGFTTLIAVVNVVLMTALATLGAFLYNLSASLLGGLELTLAEDD